MGLQGLPAFLPRLLHGGRLPAGRPGFLLEELGEDGFNSLGSANAHWVSFLDTATIPWQVSTAGLPLAIEFGPRTAG